MKLLFMISTTLVVDKLDCLWLSVYIVGVIPNIPFGVYDAIFIGLTTDRRILYDKINKRVDEMISQGLLEEVKSFYDKGIKSKPLLNAIGYRELYNYLDGNYTKEEAIEKIKQNSRHYAKRQYTFFNHQLPVVWFETDYNNFNNTIEKVASYIDSN